MLERCIGVSQEMQANDAHNCSKSTEKEETDHNDLLRRSHLQILDVVYWKQ